MKTLIFTLCLAVAAVNAVADGLQGGGGTNIFNYTNTFVYPATASIGTVTTLPTGASATVTQTGTSNALTFNFGIPAGASTVGTQTVTNLSSASIGSIGGVLAIYAGGGGSLTAGSFTLSASGLSSSGGNSPVVNPVGFYGNGAGVSNVSAATLTGVIPSAGIVTNAPGFWQAAPPGPTGATGAAGSAGANGSNGSNGSNGVNGTNAVILTHSFTLSSGLSQTWGHSYGKAPVMLNGLLVCNTSDGGMVPGQSISMANVQDDSWSEPYFGIWSDSTNLYVAAPITSLSVAIIECRGARNNVTNWSDFSFLIQYQ